MKGITRRLSPTVLIVIAGIVIAAAAFGGGLALSSRNSDKQAGPIQTNCDGTCVALYAESALPDAVAVVNGSFVQFNSADGKRHNLSIGGDDTHHTAQTVEEFTSGDFEADEAWRVQFKKDGTYSFKDKYNDSIRVNVIVYTEGKDYKLN